MGGPNISDHPLAALCYGVNASVSALMPASVLPVTDGSDNPREGDKSHSKTGAAPEAYKAACMVVRDEGSFLAPPKYRPGRAGSCCIC